MEKKERLKQCRDLLLKLHKTMLDLERGLYEGIHGQQTAGQFLNILLENDDFAWLRRFSLLIVEIDELFDQKDGIREEDLDAAQAKVAELVSMEGGDDYFVDKYKYALQHSVEAASLQSELRSLVVGPA
ncbi:MAG: hypothetical protein JFAIHJKO_00549 [Pyrinomonadaceae bacterium]|nr:hypothetical protein [Pyrinomonadaceae bacterium]